MVFLAVPIYAPRMSERADIPGMAEAQQAIAAELRARLARKRLSDTEMARRLGVGQSWFTRRKNGDTPLSAQELWLVCNVMDENMAEVVAAAWGTTNPCLSLSLELCAEQMTEWARRGFEYAASRYGAQSTLDGAAQVA